MPTIFLFAMRMRVPFDVRVFFSTTNQFLFANRIFIQADGLRVWNLQNPKAPRFITIVPIEFSTAGRPLFWGKPISSHMMFFYIISSSHAIYMSLSSPKYLPVFFPQRLGFPGVFEFDQLAGAIAGSGATESWVNDDKSYVKSTLLILTNHEVGSLGGPEKCLPQSKFVY